MTLEIFIIWLILWMIFLVLSMVETRGILFGFLAGIYPLILGVYLYLDGIQVHTGMTITSSTGLQIVEKVFTNSVPPFSSYGMLIGIPMVLLGLYISYLAATKKSV